MSLWKKDFPDLYTPGHGSTAYRVHRYELDLDCRLSSNRLSGRARIRATTERDLEVVALSLSGLRALKVQLDGSKPEKVVQRGRQLLITPRRSIAAGQAFHLEIRYEGNPEPLTGPWGDVGWEELEDGVLVAGQPVGAPSWFPCNDHPSQKASFRIAVTADAGYRVVSNGLLTGHSTKASRESWVYEQHEPMATYLATLQIGRYALRELGIVEPRVEPQEESHGPEQDEPTRSGERVRLHLAVPIALERQASQGLAHQSRVLKFFVDHFGPYPFHDYTIVVTEDELEIPLEAQSLSIIGRNHLGSDWECQRLLAHELAHQWFGNSVTASRWQDIWLHEGFACYAEWLWSEEAGLLSTAARASAAWERLRTSPQDLAIGDPGPELMFDDRVYKRGAVALHAVRTAVGKELFFDSLKEYGTRYRHRNASTADFIAVLDETCQIIPGFDAATLLRPWLEELPLPPFPA